MADFLAGELIDGGTKEKVKPLVEIRILTKTSCFNRSRLVEAGVVESLMKLLRLGDRTIQENTMAAILNLSKGIAGKFESVEAGGLEMIVEVLNEGARAESRKHAAAAIFYLFSRRLLQIDRRDPEFDSSRFRSVGSCEIREVGDGVKAIRLRFSRKSRSIDGMISVLRRGGLKLTVKILSLSMKQHCVVLLLNLCVNGGSDVVGALAKDPSIVGSLYMVLSNGDCGGGRKASALIKIIHEFQVGMAKFEPVRGSGPFELAAGRDWLLRFRSEFLAGLAG
ncbi:unnamed protein product [Brassica napus]|uniref:(rape) hypothetical protein n=1 Tax=Brassica napus TaxID=3708 RepID=A0A816JGZ8_BRANA|nr:unnamed protein product [Brassica napus]